MPGDSVAIEIGQEAPDFTLKNQYGEDVTLSAFRGDKRVVVMFYPFAFSGVCTGELCELRDELPDLGGEDVEVLAISSDPMFSLRAFSDQEKFSFSLLSDFWPHGDVAKTYGVFVEKVGAASRGTYIIDTEGIVRWKVENGLPDARDLGEYKAALAAMG